MAHPTRIFKTPEELLQAWSKYKDRLLIESKKWEKIQYVGKDGDRRSDYPKLPLTYEGFKVYCYDNHGTVHHYFDNKDSYYDVFGDVCSRIKSEIRADQIAGGMLGFYNPSITQRLNGLTDNKSVEVKGGLNIPQVPDIGERE